MRKDDEMKKKGFVIVFLGQQNALTICWRESGKGGVAQSD
jgi:hypothetical protein